MMAANMANELENEGKISLEGLLKLRKGVNKYAENLESADVEYARKKEEKRREEEKKNNKKKRKGKKKKRKKKQEEQRKKKEEKKLEKKSVKRTTRLEENWN